MFVSMSVLGQSKVSLGMIGSVDVTALSPMGGTMPSMGYQSGIRVRYQFTKVFSMQTGISFVSHQLASGKQEIDRSGWQPIVAPSPDGLQAFEVNHQIQLLKVPVLGSFYFGDKWKVGFTTGISYYHTLKVNEEQIRYYESHTETEHSTRDTYRGFSESVWGALGAGVEYQTRRLSFRIEPMANYQLLGWSKISTLNLTSLWSVGLNMAMFYHF
jgi:hypothetical protein